VFREDKDHLQGALFNSSHLMDDRIWAKLENTWAAPEKPFACLYCADNGWPNFPVNILLSLEFIKHLKNYNDEDLIDQYHFNYQVSCAVGQGCSGRLHLGRRTLCDFRERIYRYAVEHPDEEDLIFEQFGTLNTRLIDTLNLDLKEQRTDFTMIRPNVKWAGQLSLAYDVLTQAAKVCPKRDPE